MEGRKDWFCMHGSGNYMEQFRLYRLSIDRWLESPCKTNALSVKLVNRRALTVTGENLSNKLPNLTYYLPF